MLSMGVLDFKVDRIEEMGLLGASFLLYFLPLNRFQNGGSWQSQIHLQGRNYQELQEATTCYQPLHGDPT